MRGLFVKHTRTGNPLVDSVAEHQPASQQAYWQYLHYMCYCAPVGMGLIAVRAAPISNVLQAVGATEWWQRRDQAKTFLLLYGAVTYFFSMKMVRLVLLLGPVSSALGGIALGTAAEWVAMQSLALLPMLEEGQDKKAEGESEGDKDKKEGKKEKEAKVVKRSKVGLSDQTKKELAAAYSKVEAVGGLLYCSIPGRLLRVMLAAYMCYAVRPFAKEFNDYCRQLALGMSNPSIVYKANLQNGQTIILNDYLDAYFWLRDKTPKDARVMAWWDYGYQITGIGDRTTIADGNTWNHEHIATLGKMFASPEEESHAIVRHLADYVLVWTGGGGDDLAKSPHMARIGNSVYPGLCPGDPTCRMFGFMDRQGTPTPMMGRSMLYKLIMHQRRPGVVADETMWREVYSSKYQKVRIFKVLKVSKKSRNWLADPANRICDAPGSWYCVGQYPPAIQELINSRVSFKQLEDFNRGGGDSKYVEQYMKRMAGEAVPNEDRAAMLEYYKAFAPASKASAAWENTELTTHLYSLVQANDVNGMRELLRAAPSAVHTRAGDGRGPLWWAYEFGRPEMRKLLVRWGRRWRGPACCPRVCVGGCGGLDRQGGAVVPGMEVMMVLMMGGCGSAGVDVDAKDGRGIKASDLEVGGGEKKKKKSKKKSKKKNDEM